MTNVLRRVGWVLRYWLNADHATTNASAPNRFQVDWLRCLPFILMHVACLGVIWVGWSWASVGIAAALYLVRMFAITGFYHRYFSHRTFKTSRWFQFVGALAGNAAAQGGPLWWAAHHRHHHRTSDQEDDVHSPHRRGLLWSHLFWFMSRAHVATNYDAVPDFADCRELRILNQYHIVTPFALGFALWGVGVALEAFAPWLGVTGWQLLVWGFFVSTVVLFHATSTINSLAHLFGRRRFDTADTSRNNFLLSLITLGEGWHNNHHYFPGTVRQGFYWWEIDVTYYGLVVLSWLGLIWDLNPVPSRVYARAGERRALDVPEPA